MTREYRQPVYRPPAGAMDLLLIRHGESAPARPGERFPMKDGQGDPPLHPNGEAQARAIAERLQNEPLDAVYVTPLRRTHQTAAPLLERLRLHPFEEPDLREVHLGDWDGGEYRIRAANNDPTWRHGRAPVCLSRRRQRLDQPPGDPRPDHDPAQLQRLRASRLIMQTLLLSGRKYPRRRHRGGRKTAAIPRLHRLNPW